MHVRAATAADLPGLAELAAPLQQRSERHVVYIGTDSSGIRAELAELDIGPASAVAVEQHDDGRDSIAGWLIGDVDVDMGRVWWIGPFVASDDWQPAADLLLAEARRRLPAEVVEEEMAVDSRFVEFGPWAAGHGFVAEEGSWALSLRAAIDGPAQTGAAICRPMSEPDHGAVAGLHDLLFPGTHTTGSRLVEQHDEHPRLVAVADGAVVGYVAVERQADGSGYIDYVGVQPARRRLGIGADLVRAGVDALRALDADPIHLTVREGSAGARELYRSIGFDEDRLIRPYRRGFTIA